MRRSQTHRHGYGEAAAATLVEKMLSAVFFCHSHQVVHRDIKLDKCARKQPAITLNPDVPAELWERQTIYAVC